jgi:hypothetical protein
MTGPTYVAEYEYSAKGSNELSIVEGDELVGLEGEKDGWILVKNAKTQKEGLVPFDYIKATTSSSSISGGVGTIRKSNTSISGASGRAKERKHFTAIDGYFLQDPKLLLAILVTALYDYTASDDSEISFRAGDTIEVTEAAEPSEDAWWEGRNTRTGKTGQFPLVFTKGWNTNVSSASNQSISKFAGSAIGSALSGSALSGSASRLSTISAATGSRPLSTLASVADKLGGGSNQGSGRASVTSIGASVANDLRKSTTSIGSGRSGADGFSVKALYDYNAAVEGELSFKSGDYIKILDSSDPDWWTGQFRGAKGYLPAAYVERV